MIEQFKQWAEEFLGAETETIQSDDDMEILSKMILSDGNSFIKRDGQEGQYPFMIELIMKRAEYLGLEMNDQTIFEGGRLRGRFRKPHRQREAQAFPTAALSPRRRELWRPV